MWCYCFGQVVNLSVAFQIQRVKLERKTISFKIKWSNTDFVVSSSTHTEIISDREIFFQKHFYQKSFGEKNDSSLKRPNPQGFRKSPTPKKVRSFWTFTLHSLLGVSEKPKNGIQICDFDFGWSKYFSEPSYTASKIQKSTFQSLDSDRSLGFRPVPWWVGRWFASSSERFRDLYRFSGAF